MGRYVLLKIFKLTHIQFDSIGKSFKLKMTEKMEYESWGRHT